MSAWPIDDTHDLARTNWVTGADGHPDFPVQNLPYTIFSVAGGEPRAGGTLNALFALPVPDRLALPRWLSELLSGDALRDQIEPSLRVAADCALHLPCAIGPMKITRGGGEPVALPGGETRTFLEDGDEIVLTARAEEEGFVGIGFGAGRAVVSPAPTTG